MRLPLSLLFMGLVFLDASMAFGQSSGSTPPAPVTLDLSAQPATATTNKTTSATAIASPIATPASAVPTAEKSPAPPVIPPPDSVPDNVNPFADEKNLPKSLPTINAACLPMGADIKIIQFDGVGVLRFFAEGPDFEWDFEPLTDWTIAPKNYTESFAFVYSKAPTARLSFCLYAAKDFMPAVTPAAIIQYLAAVRDGDPKGFILTTPIPKGSPGLPMNHIANYAGQGVTYATTFPTLQLHHDWLADLNGQYVLVVKLVSPPALMERLESQLHAVFERGVARKGLGTVQPGDEPPAGTPKPKAE